MGFLVIFFLGIAAILIIAKVASKMRPKEERLLEDQISDNQSLDHADDPKETLDALISILIRKEVLNREELLLEIAANRKLSQ